MEKKVKTKWTDAQQSVIDTENKNILVSAAAGAGKTTILVARIIKMITDKDEAVDIDKLVVITFTRAAAVQMKQKISDELEKLIEAEPENRLYRRQYRLLGNAAICTIDSFCLSIVRSYFQKLDLDPAFRIADETELKLIKSDTMEELMEKYHELADEDFYYLIDAYCGFKSEDNLTGYISNLAEKALAQPWPEKWLDAMLKDYEIADAAQFDSSSISKKVFAYVKSLLTGIKRKVTEAKKLSVTDDGAPDYTATLEAEEAAIDLALNATGYSDLGEKLQSIQFGRLSPKKTGIAEIKDKIKTIREKYKDRLKSLGKDFFFTDTKTIVGLLQKSLPAVRCLVKMTKEYLTLLAAKKREKNVIDFSDAEHFALNILWGESPEALELRNRYREIIIDEYQDSNNLQEYIAKAIAGDCTEKPYIFTVGDVKQSIYKFRNACPELFVTKQKLYAEKKENGELIILDNNFRSREEVLDSTNAVFKHVMHESLGGIDYDEKCSLKKGTDKQKSLGENSPYTTEVHIISKTLEADADQENETKEDEYTSELNESKQVLEARLIANRIKKLINEDQLLLPDEEKEGVMRPVTYSDIMILLRTMKKWSSVFAETLEAEGIPVFSEESEGFFKAQEVALVIDFLKILDNPRQDIPFAAVLYSCIGDFNENELADIRISGGKECSFYDAALSTLEINKKRLTDGSSETGVTGASGSIEKLDKFFKIFRELESFRQTASVSELIDKIYDLTGLYDYYSAFPDGERRKANLDMLPAYAVQFESTSYSGLFGFIRYYEKLKGRDLDYGEAGDTPVGNCVRIMSIHKSKGLEFPVVFVAGMGKQFNFEDFKGDICISSDGGIGIKYVDVERRVKYPSFYHAVLKLRGTEDIVGEEMRLLYVAMTRAKHKLILTGYSDKLGTGTEYSDLVNAKNFLDFVYPVLDVEKKYFDVKTYSPDTVSSMYRQDALTETAGTDVNTDNLVKKEAGISPACGVENSVENVSHDIHSLKEKIRNIRDQKYKYDSEEALPVKLSVSDLKHQQIEDEFGENVFEETREFLPGDKTLPDFLKTEEKLSRGTDYGTLVHKCMQFIPMTLRTEEEVGVFLNEMETKGRLNPEERAMLPVRKVVNFLNSPLADRIRLADADKHFYREKQFMILMDAKEIISGYEETDDNNTHIPVQGVIDALFIENGEIVILDYKTDRVNPGEEDKLVKLYKKQLDVYAEAAERLLGLPVKEKLLYSFSIEKEIAVE